MGSNRERDTSTSEAGTELHSDRKGKDAILEDFSADTTWEEAVGHFHQEAWEEYGKQKLIRLVENHSDLEMTSERDRGFDFIIGDRDVYPDLRNDDHLDLLYQSSVSCRVSGLSKRRERRFINEVKLHLPAAPEALQGDIEDTLQIDDFDRFGVHFVSGRLGGIPAPDGVLYPHILASEECTFDELFDVIERAITVYQDVFDGGDNAIKKPPSDGGE